MNILIEEVTEWPRCNAVKGLLIYKENEKPCTKQKMWNTNLNSEKIFFKHKSAAAIQYKWSDCKGHNVLNYLDEF